MESLRIDLANNPQNVTATVRRNRRINLTGPAALDGRSDSSRQHFASEVPFDKAKTAAYLTFGMCEVFDLMEAGQWYQAEAQLALLLASAEQAALREWRWTTAWLLTHLPEPPWHSISHPVNRQSVRPLGRLASQGWIAATIAYTKDVSIIDEAEKRLGPPGRKKGDGGKGGGADGGDG